MIRLRSFAAFLLSTLFMLGSLIVPLSGALFRQYDAITKSDAFSAFWFELPAISEFARMPELGAVRSFITRYSWRSDRSMQIAL